MRPLILLFFTFFAVVSAFSHPGDGLDIDSRGNIYFTDVYRKTVWRLMKDGSLTAVVKNKWAHGLHIDKLDRIWLEVEIDNTRYSIIRIETDGSETTIIEPKERGFDVYGVNILANEKGDVYFPHSNPPDHFATGIRVRDSEGRTKLLAGGAEYSQLDGFGNKARFAGINSMRFGPNGNIYVVDQNAVRLVRLDGKVKTLFKDIKDANPENQPFDNGNPSVSNRLYGLDISKEGDIYLAYHGNRCVIKCKDSKKEIAYRSIKPWSPVGVALRGDDLIIKETGLEPGSDHPGPRISLLKKDGTTSILTTLEK